MGVTRIGLSLEIWLSASQVETYAVCPRKWGWRYIAGIKTEQNRSAKIGDATHKQLEGHLQGKPLDFTQSVEGVRIANVAASGIHLLPDPQDVDPAWIETEFRYEAPSTGIIWIGRQDLVAPDGCIFPEVEDQPSVPHGAPVVHDHKTTSHLNYAKTVEGLTWDFQANLYAYMRMVQTKRDGADLVWTYYTTRPPHKAKRVHLRVHSDHAARAFKGLNYLGAEMAAHKQAAAQSGDPYEYVRRAMPYNPGACNRFNTTCSYASNCQLTIGESMRSDKMDDFFTTLESAVQSAEQSVMGCADNEVPTATHIPAAFLTDSINSPEANQPKPSQASMLPPQTITMTITCEPAEEKKRGRPKGSKNKVKDEPSPTAADGDILITGKAGDVTITRSDDGAKIVQAHGITLFVDCRQDGGDLISADRLIAMANERICQEENVRHYKLLQFGAASAALDLALNEVVDELVSQGVVSDIFCSSRSEALPTLTRRAARIIRAVAA